MEVPFFTTYCTRVKAATAGRYGEGKRKSRDVLRVCQLKLPKLAEAYWHALNKTLNKTTQPGPMNPTEADWRTRNLLILHAPAAE